MKGVRYIYYFLMILLLQLFITRYGQLEWMYISLLPAMIMCLPTVLPTSVNCIIAFALGITVDFCADGVMGLNTIALLPLAAINRSMLSLVISEELVERGYSFSFHQHGIFKIGLLLFIYLCIFFLIYILMDTNPQKDFAMTVTKLLCSTASSMVFGLIVCNVLCPRPLR